MKNAVKWISLAAAAAVLLTACNNNGGEDIDLAPFPIETEDTRASLDELRRSTMTPFIMPPEGTEEYEHYSSLLTWGDDCVPGHLYLLSKVNSSTEAILKISDRVFRIETGLVNVQPKDRRMIYAVEITDGGDCLMKIDQETGHETVLYSAGGKAIAYLTASDHLSPYSTLSEDEYLYFSDGANIMQLDFFSEEVTILAESEAPVQELMIYKKQVVWLDAEGAYYLYNAETGESVSVTYEDLHPFSDSYFYNIYPREDDPEVSDLYLQTLETLEMELVLENITKTLYAFTVSGQKDVLTLYLQVGKEYIASANQNSGEINTVYRAVTDDMELITAATTWAVVPDNAQLEGIYVRDGNEVVRVDGVTLDAGTLFLLKNGLSELHCSPFAQDNKFVYDSHSHESDEEFYVCGECDENDLMYFVWADKDGNWFWYHPHSGENEEIEITAGERGYYFIRQKD